MPTSPPPRSWFGTKDRIDRIDGIAPFKPVSVDSLGAEILRHALRVAAEEASIVVVRSAHSTLIVEGADASAALLGADGRLVALSTATSLMHAASLRSSLPALIEDNPIDGMEDGDVFVMNDPFRGGIHANDLLIFRPIFASESEGASKRVLWFAGTLIHVADLGGISSGGLAATATDVFGEGLQLPPVLLYKGGQPVKDLHRIIELNSRLPARVMGDIAALVAGVNVLDRRMQALVARYGAQTLCAGIDDYISSTRARMSDGLERLPAGVYRGEYVIDSDGIEVDRALTVRVAVTIGNGQKSDGTITLDFDGTDGQVSGSINAGFSQALTGVYYAVRCFVEPTIPMNEGCFSPISVHLPWGSLLNPRPPAACGGRVVPVFAAVEAILDALAEAMPERAVAASSVIHPYAISGRNHDGSPYSLLSFEFGGIGGRCGSDGPDATGAFFLGGRNMVPQVEAVEAALPLRIESQGYAIDSGGPGRWRGGAGMETRVRLLSDGEIAVRSERVRFPPQGRNGGGNGSPGSQVIDRDGEEFQLPSKAVNIPANADDIFVLTTSGGGGLGDPFERDPAAVQADVAGRKVSRLAAERDYGVVLNRFDEVDEVATFNLRGANDETRVGC